MSINKKAKQFSIIVAHDQNNGIGFNDQLPWQLSQDMAYFKQTTMGMKPYHNTVIMGRKTWESIPNSFRPLQNRKNIVLTRNKIHKLEEGVEVASTLEDAISVATGTVFVIGGSMVYENAIHNSACDKLYVTEIQSRFNCDRFFPEYKNQFDLISESDDYYENGHQFKFKQYAYLEKNRNS